MLSFTELNEAQGVVQGLRPCRTDMQGLFAQCLLTGNCNIAPFIAVVQSISPASICKPPGAMQPRD